MVDAILRVSAGLLTPVVAGFAVYIAWQQYKTARDKLRLDLYERRYKVYRGLMELFIAISTEGELSQEHLRAFTGDTDQKRFLFKQDVRSYLKTVYENAIKLWQARKMLGDQRAPDDLREKAGNVDAELSTWFETQYDGEAERLFEPYLGFYHKL